MAKSKVERKAYEKAWREANRKRLAEQNKAYRTAHAEELKIKSKVYYERVKEDRNAKIREDRKANPEKYRGSDKARRAKLDKHRLRKANFDRMTYDLALEVQGFKCAICQVDLRGISKFRVHADHCHVSGKPRGILCGNCNQGLGLFKDSEERLLAAIEYLKNNPLSLL